MAIQLILIPQELEGQINSHPVYFKAGREIHPPLSTNDLLRLQLEGMDLLIPTFHPRDKFINSTRKPSKKHSLRQLPG